jgi:hypothetical protein
MTAFTTEAPPDQVDRSAAPGEAGARGRRLGPAVVVATVAAFVLSATWYVVWAGPYAELRTGTVPAAMPWWTVLVELGRSAVVATAVAVALRRLALPTWGSALAFAASVWVAFPVVLLVGSVVHEGVPPLLAAIHAGDWLLKLVLITVLVRWIGRPRSRATR